MLTASAVLSIAIRLLVLDELSQIMFGWFTALESMIVYDTDTLLLEQFTHRFIRIKQILLMYEAGLIILILCRHIFIVFTNLQRFHANNLLAKAFMEFWIIEFLCRTECDNGTVFADLSNILGGADIGGCRVSIASKPQIVVHLKAKRPPNARIFPDGANEKSQIIGQCVALWG